MSEEEYESPYCEVCGHCGEIGCCGIRNFIEEHIEGKTNCKNEAYIIQDLIDLCDYKDEVFEKNKKLEFQLQQKENIIKEVRELTEMLYKNEANIFYKGTYKKQLDILDKENK